MPVRTPPAPRGILNGTVPPGAPKQTTLLIRTMSKFVLPGLYVSFFRFPYFFVPGPAGSWLSPGCLGVSWGARLRLASNFMAKFFRVCWFCDYRWKKCPAYRPCPCEPGRCLTQTFVIVKACHTNTQASAEARYDAQGPKRLR